MAKSPKIRVPETIVDDDGCETDGMFKWGGQKVSYDFEKFSQWAEEWNKEYLKPASDRIDELRRWLTEVILPHVDGPIDRAAFDNPAPEIIGRTLTHLNLSTASGCYAIHAGMPKGGFFNDALDGLRALDELNHVLSKESKNVDQIVRISVRIGILLSRVQLRAWFGPEVLLAMKRRKASAKGGKATAKWNAEVESLARPLAAEALRGRMSETAAYKRVSLKLLSEHGISVSPKTLKRHLSSSIQDNA
jgi:hypothetical protein